MPLPEFNAAGDLPPYVHQATLQEVIDRFGLATVRRQVMVLRLERIFQIATETGHLARFIVFGSFITEKAEPNDVDVFMLMEDSFDFAELTGDAHLLFSHGTAQDHFGSSVFWVRRLAALDGEEATIEHWQFKRDGERRGIIEIVPEEK